MAQYRHSPWKFKTPSCFYSGQIGKLVKRNVSFDLGKLGSNYIYIYICKKTHPLRGFEVTENVETNQIKQYVTKKFINFFHLILPTIMKTSILFRQQMLSSTIIIIFFVVIGTSRKCFDVAQDIVRHQFHLACSENLQIFRECKEN